MQGARGGEMTGRQDDWAERLRERAEGLLVDLGRAAAEAVPRAHRAQPGHDRSHGASKPSHAGDDRPGVPRRSSSFAAVCVNPATSPGAPGPGGRRERRLFGGGVPAGGQCLRGQGLRWSGRRRGPRDRYGDPDRRAQGGRLCHGARRHAAVVERCHARGAICKVIIEAAFLNDQERRRLPAPGRGGRRFAKTSTGFGPGAPRSTTCA